MQFNIVHCNIKFNLTIINILCFGVSIFFSLFLLACLGGGVVVVEEPI